MNKKKREYANQNYRIKHGETITGIIISQEEEAIIGHLIEKDDIFVPDGGMVFDDGVKGYVIVEVDTFDVDDLVETPHCADFMKDILNLRKNKVVDVCSPLTVVEVMDASFGYF